MSIYGHAILNEDFITNAIYKKTGLKDSDLYDTKNLKKKIAMLMKGKSQKEKNKLGVDIINMACSVSGNSRGTLIPKEYKPVIAPVAKLVSNYLDDKSKKEAIKYIKSMYAGINYSGPTGLTNLALNKIGDKLGWEDPDVKDMRDAISYLE